MQKRTHFEKIGASAQEKRGYGGVAKIGAFGQVGRPAAHGIGGGHRIPGNKKPPEGGSLLIVYLCCP